MRFSIGHRSTPATFRLGVLLVACSLGAVLGVSGVAQAQEEGPLSTALLDSNIESMVVYGRAERLIEIATAGSEGRVGRADLEFRPIARIGELLETIPGVIATQHSGPGKGNQLYLRGFNLDHGTDFAVEFDGVPINFRTHGHGQGYLDLNFVIPELVASLDFRKGPYRADVGDFSSAGSSFFRTFDQLPDSMASVTVGEDRFVRGLVASNIESDFGDWIVALEGKTFDDPFDLDADLLHLNVFSKLTRDLGPGKLRASALAYHAEWSSTDQVPRRAIESGQISRLGFIDPDLGGETTRVGLNLQWEDEGGGGLSAATYLIYYRFKLFSNFTYFLDQTVQGDEFGQRDERVAWGARVEKAHSFDLLGQSIDTESGFDTRLDAIFDLSLDRTAGRQRIERTRRDNVTEWSGSLYTEWRGSPFEWLSWMVGVRGDLFVFDVDAREGIGDFTNSGTEVDGLVSPKVALILKPHEAFEIYLNGGGGFHSNDARGTTIRQDPADNGAPVGSVDPLARSWGAELGLRFQPNSNLHLTSALWFLRSESELVFVGDAGTTEPQGGSVRYGIELSGFYRPVDWLAFDASYSISDAEFKGLPTGRDRIPSAIETVVSAGATVTAGPFSGSFRLRHFGAYPLVEDNTQRAGSTTLVNLGANYDWKNLRFGVTVLNLFDSKDSDIEYFFASQLAGEAAPVEDVHLHTVAPRQVRASVTARF